jgi:hypothetical protein
MHPADSVSHRAELLVAAVSFVRAVRAIPGVRQISLVGSIVTPRANPKDIDFLIQITDDADVRVLARHGRRLQGRAQQCNRGADIFLADERGQYLGRTCQWKDCRPGVRMACDARHCGRRPHLHDDLDAVVLAATVVAEPPVTLWPELIRRVALPADVEAMITELQHAV